MNPLHRQVALLLLATLTLAACGPGEEDAPEPQGLIAQTDLGNYWVRMSHDDEHVPYNEYTSLEFEVFTDEGLKTPAEAVEVEFDAEVVELGKDMPTAPEITSPSSATFRVDGVLLHVPRAWEIELVVKEDGFEETAVFEVDPSDSFPQGTDPTGFFTDDEVSRIYNMSPETIELPPAPSNGVADSSDAAELGQALFFEEGLSSNGEVSCASCHQPDKGFADGLKLSEGLGETPRHAPTVLNAAFNRWQFWDGRVDSLWSQSLQPFEADKEHDFSRMEVVRFVAEDPQMSAAYRELFGELPDVSDETRFPERARPLPGSPEHPDHQAWMSMSEADRQAVSLAYANLGKSIGAYERRLVSLNSPFDRYVDALRAGDTQAMDQAMTESQKRGLKLYLNDGACDLCHAGPMMTNFEFHNLNLRPRPWNQGEDEGRLAGAVDVQTEEFSVTGPFSDTDDVPAKHRFLKTDDFLQKGAFKTPTLRNVARTAPYMHGGQHATLEEVIEFYSDLQESSEFGRRDPLLQASEMSPEDIDDMVAFMEALDGEPLPSELTTAPTLD
jgi:cytochrome c peroxidase